MSALAKLAGSIGAGAGLRQLLVTMAALASPALASAADASPKTMTSEAAPAAPGTSASQTPLASPAQPGRPRRADFLGDVVSDDARRVADWVVGSGDNNGLPFVIVDKIRAKVFVFENGGRLRGSTLALLGTARGDDTVPGIGSRKLSTIRPDERTTPAGRFVAALGHDLQRDILWIDYETSLSLHRVITGNPNDHRLRRLATASASDKRITYGCVNVPVEFYENIVLPTFTGTAGIVYILPEIKPIQDVFSLSKVADGAVGGGGVRIP